MKKRKKKVSKNKKKFFIILSCYVVVFLITCIVTASTLAWFSSSTWSTNTVYLGGPVYIYFSDSSGVKETSKENNLTLETPPGWDYLYPGMNVHIGARAVVQGAKFENIKENGDTTYVYTTGAILRARISVTVTDPYGSTTSPVTQDIYRNLWAQIKDKALTLNDDRNEGVWVMDDDYDYKTHTIISDGSPDTGIDEDHFFYYVSKNQNYEDSGKYSLVTVGGTENNISVGFLDDAVLTLSGKQLTNDHADCILTFKIIFHALQAFLPYTNADLGTPYQGDTTNRSPHVIFSDLGTPKPVTIENSRIYFKESFQAIYDGIDGAIY